MITFVCDKLKYYAKGYFFMQKYIRENEYFIYAQPSTN